MSEEIKPDVQKTADVEEPKDNFQEIKETVVNYAEKTLAELSELFEKFMDDADKVRKPKEAEAIKSAFYKKLSKEKAEAGLSSEVAEPAEDEVAEGVSESTADDAGIEETAASADNAVENVDKADGSKTNPFEAIEEGFKSLYAKYKKERAEYNKKQEAEKADNLVKKQAVIDDLKALVEKEGEVSAAFPEFREIQARWRAIGPVPIQNFRVLNDTYQFYVEQFYDKVQINRDMRDLDFKKNLEAKTEFCEKAEKLAEDENVVEAFKELQKLHEQWKEFGPVAKEYRESIWERFKAATAVINKKYQAFFEAQKEKQSENLAEKTKLCEEVEAIADREDVKSSGEWNSLTKQIEEIQQKWRTIGYASRKENQKIYDRFRAACDKFFEKKRVFYTEFKDSMNENLEKKMSLIDQAEALKSSTEWKKATDQFIALQKQWKEIGAVPRKKSEQLWKRFRAACDEFFAERDRQAKPENNFYANLKAKRALIEEINAFQSDDEQVVKDAMQNFSERWNAIGFVPFKEKESVTQAYRDAMHAKFPQFAERGGRGERRDSARQRASSRPLSEKEKLIQKYNGLQQQIDTYENNIGFFAASKNSRPLIQQMQDRIDAAKKELKELEEQIRQIENTPEQ